MKRVAIGWARRVFFSCGVGGTDGSARGRVFPSCYYAAGDQTGDRILRPVFVPMTRLSREDVAGIRELSWVMVGTLAIGAHPGLALWGVVVAICPCCSLASVLWHG